MRRFSTYIASHLFGPLLVVAFSFTGVVWLTQSLRFIDLIINKGLSFGLFLYMTVLLLPSLLTTNVARDPRHDGDRRSGGVAGTRHWTIIQ